MLVEIFIEGLCLAFESFQMTTFEARLGGVEAEIKNMRYEAKKLSSELQEVKDVVNRLSRQQISAFRDSSIKLLGKVNKANSLNVDVLSYFVASMGSLLTAVVFKGRKKQKEDFKFGMRTYRGFIASTQSPERIFQTLSNLQELTELTGGRIVTGAVGSKSDMKAVAVSVAAFLKVAKLFGVETCGITDEKYQKQDSLGLTIRFEDRYSISAYESYIKEHTDRVQIIKSNRRNVYILGPNGVGKSSWGNVISGEETFEVGAADHTTMIPQSIDMETSYGFRLWDTPGMYDGTEDQGLMMDYMNRVINVNGYFSAVVFVFHGMAPANDLTKKILQYAIELFGEKVKERFFVIVNDFIGNGQNYKPTYSDILYRLGYKENGRNVVVSSALANPNSECHEIRNILSSFEPRLISSHLRAYRDVMEKHGDLAQAIHNLYLHGRKELENLLRGGKIETIRYCDAGPRKNISVPKDVLKFRQHSCNLFLRRLGLGNDKVVEERTVLLRGSPYFLTLIRAQLNQEYTIGEVNIFVRHILGNERYMLIHTPKEEHDYELRDASAMTNDELRELLISHLIHETS